MKRSHAIVASSILSLCCCALTLCLGSEELVAQQQGEEASAGELSPTRKLRRVYLALVQHEPDISRYEALLQASDPDAFITQEAEALLQTPEYRDNLIDWAHEYIPFPLVQTPSPWPAAKSIVYPLCPDDSLHAGKIALIRGANSDDDSVCDDPNAATATETPWWAPETTVGLVGSAANLETTFEGKDCGEVITSNYWVMPKHKGCGCGPYLTYCSRGELGLPYEFSYPKSYRDGAVYHPLSQRRSLMEEPANLFAHIITENRPFSDLVLGNYTVVNRGLYHMYVRQGRMSGVHTDGDEDRWFDMFQNNEEWIEVLFSQMNPHLLDDPSYRYDPRIDGEMLGLSAAGVLTMIGPNYAWPRPRVRAARWLESLACDEFSPPELPVEFPPYQRDPATEGSCLHCHTRLDPAAMSFKRFIQNGVAIAGVGNWRLENLVSYNADRQRFINTLIPNTVLTPLTESEVEADLNNRLIDFMLPGQQLFGRSSDGTVGPRGFAKILVDSGKFDQCAVRRAYERFGGRSLDLGKDSRELEEAVEDFVANNRNMNELIKKLVLARDQGW